VAAPTAEESEVGRDTAAVARAAARVVSVADVAERAATVG
jgi:hypothetical protein